MFWYVLNLTIAGIIDDQKCALLFWNTGDTCNLLHLDFTEAKYKI